MTRGTKVVTNDRNSTCISSRSCCKNINVRDQALQDSLERRDLHDEGRAEIRDVRLSKYIAVRRCDRKRRDRYDETGAVDLTALEQARLHRERIAAPFTRP